jgi:hypothetical protein
VLEVNVGLYGYCRERSNEQCWTAVGLLALGRSHIMPV